MTRAVWTSALLVASCLGATGVTGAGSPQASDPGSAAWAIVEWPGGAVVASERLERLRQPAEPGSLLKIATLVAAFSTGLVTSDTRMPCAGEATVQGQIVRCSHPRLRHPLRPAEALSVSCNVWFATIGERLSRARLDGVLTAMGLPPTPAGAPMPLVATGLRAAPSPPLAWVEALSRLLRRPSAVPLSAEARATLVEGLRGAALYGTSSAFSERGLDVLAKTGTATPAAGGTLGVVVAAWPPGAPTRAVVLIASGVAGKDAADLAATVVANPSREPKASAPSAERSEAPPRREATSPPVPPLTARSAEPWTVRVGSPRAGGGYTVEVLGVEDYAARVLAGEAAAGSPPAALEALAIAVRTFAAGNLVRHRRDGFDLCTLTHCQVLRPIYPAVREAAAATSGQLLLVNGAPATVFHSASCGGRTERPSAVWPGADDLPYLPSKTDRACRGEPQWAAEIPVQDLERALVAAGYRGARLRDLDVDGRSASGRVMRVTLEGMTPDAISGQDLRMVVGRTLGWHLLKSADFTVRQTSAGYRFDGKGFGHGVGLCVLGSVRRAEHGDSARDILRAYFPGLEIGRLSAAPRAPDARKAPEAPDGPKAPEAPKAPKEPFVLTLPPSAEPERTALSAFARRALADLTRATGQPAPAGLRLVFHPSVDSFQRETGEPWWTAARTRGLRIDLLAPAVLRQRGTLESTLQHELAHVLTATPLEGRPEWVKEGVAMHFAGEPPPASVLDASGVPRRVRCPTDDDLRRPVSAAAARQAYGLAAACVARALADGVRWPDIR
jgi:SpoIID/LytB domain protein